MSEKICRLCGELKLLEAFYRATGMRDGRRSSCIACERAHRAQRYANDPEFRARARARTRAWQAENPARTAENRRRWTESGRQAASGRRGHLKRTYGLTPEQYDEMLAGQGGGCAICGVAAPAGQSLHVDHDHATGRIRGLLCFTCNAGIGMFGEDAARLTRAASYLLAGSQP